jgi:hypothetical protein
MLVFSGIFAIEGGVDAHSRRTVAASSGIMHNTPSVAWAPRHAPSPPRAAVTVAPLPSLPFSAPRHDHQYKSSWCLSLHGWNLICTTRKGQP